MRIMIALGMLAQADPLGGWGNVGMSGGIAGLVLYFWRIDRQDRAAQTKADADRYAELAKDFKEIVESNTAALTRLTDAIGVRPIVQRNAETLSQLTDALGVRAVR